MGQKYPKKMSTKYEICIAILAEYLIIKKKKKDECNITIINIYFKKLREQGFQKCVNFGYYI